MILEILRSRVSGFYLVKAGGECLGVYKTKPLALAAVYRAVEDEPDEDLNGDWFPFKDRGSKKPF